MTWNVRTDELIFRTEVRISDDVTAAEPGEEGIPMTATGPDIAQKDEPFWARPLTLNFKSFFSGVSKAITAATVQDWKKAGEAAKDLVSAIGIARSSQQFAGILLNRSMRRAIFDLLQDYRSDIQRELQEEQSARLAQQLDHDLETVRVSLDENFFDRPREIPLIPIFVQRLEQWLTSTGLTQHSPRAIAARLPSYFVYAMHCELRERRVDYSPVVQHIRTEVAEAWQRERTWQACRLRMERQLDEPMFGEGFGLRDIFLWPRGWFEKLDPAENGSTGRDDLSAETSDPVRRSGSPHARVTERHVAMLKEALDAWLSGDSAADQREQREDAIRILSGDPGAGKSSFVRMYAQHRMEQFDDRVLIVPLHLLNVTIDFEAALERYCEQLDDCPTGLLKAESAEKRLLLILDGLDELAKQGTSGAALALEFVENVETTVQRRNQSELRLQVLISGRPIAVQNVRNRFRRPGRILHLLPYFVPESERKRDGQTPWTENGERYRYGGQVSLLERDQRQDWWKNYGRLKGLSIHGLPEPLTRGKLDDITAQPLLNYLLALVYQRGNVDFSSGVTRNEIYSDLLDSVYERTWDQAQGHITTRDIQPEDFRELLEEMTLTAWHDRERVTTVKAVRVRCDAIPHLKLALEL